jgi:predicted nucleic acid-binding protein
MLALTEDGIHDLVWSDDLLDEWERVIVREQHRSPDAAAAIAATIRQFFADTRIPVESYRGLIAQVDGPHPDDNAHMEAAGAGQAESLVTWNVKDFDCDFITKHAIRIMDPDEYLCALYEELPDEMGLGLRSRCFLYHNSRNSLLQQQRPISRFGCLAGVPYKINP